MRVAAGISLGALLSMAVEDFRRAVPARAGGGRGRRAATVAVATACELAGYALLVKWLFAGHAPFPNALVVVALFPVLFLLAVTRAGWISRLFDLPVSDWPGRYAYSICVMQQIAFFLLARTLWTRTAAFAAHPMGFLVLSTLGSALLGMAAFHLVEHPASAAWRRWKKAHVPLPPRPAAGNESPSGD